MSGESKRGARKTISDDELVEILILYRTKHPVSKMSDTKLAQFAQTEGIRTADGKTIGRQIFRRRLAKQIDAANNVVDIVLPNELSTALPFPDVADIVEKYWNGNRQNKETLILALSGYNKMIQNLYDEAVRGYNLSKEKLQWEYDRSVLLDEIKGLKTALRQANEINHQNAIYSRYPSERTTRGLRENVISMDTDRKKSASITFLERVDVKLPSKAPEKD